MIQEYTVPYAKPLLDTNAQIEHLKSKGVQFQLMSKEEAYAYLEKNNNYFKVCAYRKNFDKHPGGCHEGQYIDLDFAMLVDLAVIDMRLRYVLLQMALDVEHFSKVKLLKAVMDHHEDGYQIVADYLEKLKKDGKYEQLRDELGRHKENPYCGGIKTKYENCYPIWAFIEVISMGRFTDFYEFCAKRLQNEEIKEIYYLLKPIKSLRNAAAHNNCLLFNMREQEQKHSPNVKMLQRLHTISKTTRKKKLSNERTRQITTLLYAHAYLVESEGVHKRVQMDLREVVDRMHRNTHYYRKNMVITTNLDFFEKVVDIFYP